VARCGGHGSGQRRTFRNEDPRFPQRQRSASSVVSLR
jgi:hypothetical protein